MSERKLSFFKAWLCVCWIILVGAVGGVTMQSVRITGKPQTYISLAKLVAGGRMTGGSLGGGPAYQEYLTDFYGTIIEVIESAEMRRRALDRVRALHPSVKEAEVEIQVSRNEGSAIFNIRAFGREPKYTRLFLDALLDEFIAFRNQIREQQRNKALTALAEDIVRREKALGDSHDKLTAFRKQNNVVLIIEASNEATAHIRELTKSRQQLAKQLDDLGQAGTEIGKLALALAEQSPAQSEAALPPEADGSDMPWLADRLLAGKAINLGREHHNTEKAKRLLEELRFKTTGSRDASNPPSDLDKKISTAAAILDVLGEEVQNEAKNTKAKGESSLKALDAQITHAKAEALEKASLVATHEQLARELDDKKRAYQELLDLIRGFTTSEDMTSDYVTIMERASPAMEELQDWTLPIAIGGIGGGMAGLFISLILAALIQAMSPRKEPGEA